LILGMGVPQQHHRKIFSSAGTGPALGVHVSAAASSPATSTLTTASVTTQASGSSFWICAAVPTLMTVSAASDNKGNTYTQNGSTIVGFDSASDLYRFRSVNGTGGSGHTFSISITSVPSFFSIWAVEIKNSTGGLDQQNAQVTSVSPFDSPSVTTTSANEVILGCAIDNSTGAGDNFTAATTYTLLDQVTNGSLFATGASIGKAVSTTGTFKTEVTSVQGTTMAVSIDTFK
jgi:hypothetical protein